MSENEIAKIIVNSAFKIHTTLGPGLFESVYETIMEYELVNEYGLDVKRQVHIPVTWKNLKLELGFRSDLIIENKVILELKAIDKLAPVHFRQVLTYLKLTNLKLGLIINFDEPVLSDSPSQLRMNWEVATFAATQSLLDLSKLT